MVICKVCGCKNKDDEIFCVNCGNMIMTSEYLNDETAETVITDKVEEKNEPEIVDEVSEFDVDDEAVKKPEDYIDNSGNDKKETGTDDEIVYRRGNEDIQDFYISPDDDEVMRDKRKSKKTIIISAIVVGVLLLVIAGIGMTSVFSGNNTVEASIPGENKIMKSLNKDESVTVVEINGEEQDFQVTSLEIIKSNENEINTRYKVIASAVRTNDMYELSPVEYTVVFENTGGVYEYVSAKANEEYELSLKAVGGYSVEQAEKKIKKKYDKVKFDKQETDLEKGLDRIYFTVSNKDKKGTAVVVYKFSDKDGWKFKKISEKNMKYEPGVTHKVDGLYTNSGVRNIMFFGVDADGYGGRSDVMMLVSIDTNTSKIKLTSFMRDTYVNIPGYGYNKLNAAFALGGPEAAVGAIENTYGMKIDNYAATNFTTFKNVINSLGGVSVNVTADEAGYINWQLNRNGQSGVGMVPSGGGNVRLNGQQALWLCRDRGGNGFSGDDFMRTGRQRKVITSLISTYKNYSASQVLSTLNNLLGNVKTDLDAEDLKWLADNSSSFFGFAVQGRCAPDHGEWHAGTSPGGAWIIQFNNWDQFLKDVQQDIYEDLE